MLRKTLAGLLFCTVPVFALADDGKALYEQHCSKCHGDDGLAHTARGYMYFARNLTSASWQLGQTDDDIYETISNGPGWWSVMPAFKNTLNDAEIHQLVTVVRGFAKR